MQNGDFLEAINLYNDLLSTSPNNAVYLLNRGWCQMNASGFSKGSEDLLAALRIDKNCSRCYIGLAIISMNNSAFDDALEQANYAIKSEDTASFNYFIRGQIYEALGDNYKAGYDFNSAIELNPNVADYYYSRGNFLFRVQKYALAIDDFSSAILLEPLVAEYHFQRGYTYYMQKNYRFALPDIRKAVELDSNNNDFWLGKGAVEEALGRIEESKASYSKAVKLNPNNALAFFNRANLYFDEGDMDMACLDYSNCITALGKVRFPREDMLNEASMMLADHCDTSSPSYYYQRAMVAMDLNNPEKAIEISKYGLNRWPNHPLINSFLGNAYMVLGKYPEAIEAYQNALKKSDETPSDVRNSKTLAANGVNPDVYMRQLYSSVYDGLSKCYLSLNRYEEALENVNKAIFLAEKVSDSPLLSMQLLKANILSALNRDVEAKNMLDDLIVQNPEYAQAYALRSKVLLKMAIAQGNKRAKFKYAVSPESSMFYLDTPKNYKQDKIDPFLLNSATSDCNMAIALSEGYAESYLILGQIKLFSGQKDYCNDFFKAKSLGITDALLLFGNPCEVK